MTPSGEISFDRVADSYDASRGGRERARACAVDVVAHLDGTALQDLLEIGTGTGIVAAELAALLPDARLAGLDLSAAMLDLARPRLPGRLVRASAMRLPFPDEVFDAVVAVHVLHLVPDLSTTLGEVRRVLRPGGRLVAVHAVPQHVPSTGDSGDGTDDVTAATAALAQVRTGRHDTPQQVREAAQESGLEVLHQHLGSPRPSLTTPAELAGQLQARAWSWMWQMDDERWRRDVGPVVDALRALPDQDRPRRHVTRMTVTAARRPGGEAAPSPAVDAPGRQ